MADFADRDEPARASGNSEGRVTGEFDGHGLGFPIGHSSEPDVVGPAFYTKEGDYGRTHFGAHGELSKFDKRVIASAECDEANSGISVAIAAGGLPIHVTSMLASVQNDLFDAVADLSVPFNRPEPARARIQESHIERLERAVDHFALEAGNLSGYLLPGGTVAASLLYQARTIARRAERAVWAAVEDYPEVVNPLIGRYLNRLSSLLFVIARGANVEHGDLMWVPEASARAMSAEGAAETTATAE